MSSLIGIDTYIALGLIGIIVVVFVVHRMGMLPKKSLPFVIGGLLALFGIHWFRESRRKGLRKKLEELEEQLKKKEEKLKDKKDDLDISERELQQVTAEADKQRAAYQDEIIRNEGMAEDKKKEFYELPKLEKFKRFSQPFGNG